MWKTKLAIRKRTTPHRRVTPNIGAVKRFTLSERSFERSAHRGLGQWNQNVELAAREMNFIMAEAFHPDAAIMSLNDAFG